MGRFAAYIVTNSVNGKKYVGITTQRRPEVRWAHHRNVGRRGLGLAIKKYGEQVFSFEVVAYARSIDDLLALETILIAQENSISPFGYNLNAGGNGTLGASIETRQLIGQANSRRVWSAESRAKVSKSLTGRELSESQRAKTSARMKLQNPSLETRAKISAAAKLRCASPQFKEAVRRSNSARTVTAETKAKIAASVARYAVKKREITAQLELI